MTRIRSKLLPALSFAASLAYSANAMAADCKPSKWGAEDEIGSANLITAERVMAASKLVKQGKTHPLGIIIDPKMPAYPPRSMHLEVVQPGQQHGKSLEGAVAWPMIYNDDMAQLWFGIGPQLDGLGHMGEAGYFYNCNHTNDISDFSGLKKLGIHTVPPLVGRGVLIDMAKHFGVTSLEKGQGFGSQDIKAAAEKQGVKIQEGDVVLFHTGWTDAKMNAEPDLWVSGEPGLTNEAGAFLASLNVMAVGSDTWGLGAVPPIPGDKFGYDHISLMKENGIFVLETMNTGGLAKEGVKEFLFVLGQPRVKGAVQMLVNPIALY